MAVLYRIVLIGILCLSLVNEVRCMCNSCDLAKEDKDCKDKYKPKEERMACVDLLSKKKNLCKMYKKGWKIICSWGAAKQSCSDTCPGNNSNIVSSSPATITLVASAIWTLLRLLH